MARAVFGNNEATVAHFATKDANHTALYPMVWNVVRALEGYGFKVCMKYVYGYVADRYIRTYHSSKLQVIYLSCDGASSNRSFFQMHSAPENCKHGVVYCTTNPYAQDGRCIYFMSDVPHLIKTVCKCWLSSRIQGTRYMEVCRHLDK